MAGIGNGETKPHDAFHHSTGRSRPRQRNRNPRSARSRSGACRSGRDRIPHRRTAVDRQQLRWPHRRAGQYLAADHRQPLRHSADAQGRPHLPRSGDQGLLARYRDSHEHVRADGMFRSRRAGPLRHPRSQHRRRHRRLGSLRARTLALPKKEGIFLNLRE